MKAVTFNSEGLKIAANIFYPADLEAGKKFPAIVVSHPGGAVKEQTSGLYAQKLSEQGFITLAFDAAYHGESEGLPRGFEKPEQRVEDIRAAADYLATLDDVDPENIGVLGICASGGYALVATATNKNIKALATVSGVDLGDWYRKGLNGDQEPAVFQNMLAAASADRISVAKGNEPGTFSIRFDEATAKALGGTNYEGYEYYSTPRAHHPNQTDNFVWKSIERIAAFYSPHFAEMISPRPFLAIAGADAESLWLTKDAINHAKEPKELYIIPGATHVSLYDDLSQTLPKLTKFFKDNLK